MFDVWEGIRSTKSNSSVQTEAILTLLRIRPRGTLELSKRFPKYTSRISDLRQRGHTITFAEVSGGPQGIYTLVQ